MFLLGLAAYVILSVAVLGAAARQGFGHGLAAAPVLWRRLLVWAGLSGICGSLLFSTTGCGTLLVLDGGPVREDFSSWAFCSIFSNVWALPVVVALLPGYLALLAWWVRSARRVPSWEDSLRGVTFGVGLLALPGFAVVLASYLFPPMFGWGKVWRDFLAHAPWLAVSFWGALLLPRLLLRALRPGVFGLLASSARAQPANEGDKPAP